MILHFARSSGHIPDEYAYSFDSVLAETSIDLKFIIEKLNSDIPNFEHPRIKKLSAQVSPLLIDMTLNRDEIERSLDKAPTDNQQQKPKPPLAKFTKWVRKKITEALLGQKTEQVSYKSLYKAVQQTLTSEQIRNLLTQYYEPHHAELEKLVQLEIDEFSSCLIVDYHTFSVLQSNQIDERVDIRIEFDKNHFHEELLIDVCRFLTKHNLSYEINKKKLASSIPTMFYQKDERVKLIKIMVNDNLEEQTIKGHMAKLLPYLAGDKHALTKKDFDGEHYKEVAKADDWTCYEIEAWSFEPIEISPNETSGPFKMWEKSVPMSFSAPSCDTNIELWVSVSGFYTIKKEFHSVQVKMEEDFMSPRPMQLCYVDGSLYFFEGNQVEYLEGDTQLIYCTSEGFDLETKLLKVAQMYFEEELKQQGYDEYIASHNDL